MLNIYVQANFIHLQVLDLAMPPRYDVDVLVNQLRFCVYID